MGPARRQAEAKAGGGGDQNIVVHGRGPGNWEVLIDGQAVARFESRKEAEQWVEIFRAKGE